MAAEEPVSSPDQHKPENTKLAKLGAVLTIIVLLAMLCGNHKGRIEDWFLAITAGGIALILIGDWLLRKNGLR